MLSNIEQKSNYFKKKYFIKVRTITNKSKQFIQEAFGVIGNYIIHFIYQERI